MSNSSQWPVDPYTKVPLTPRAQPGYYPGFRTLDQKRFWDKATRDVVLRRVDEISPNRFFSDEEARLLDAVCARVLPQDDRDEAHRIPIVNGIDERLFEYRTDGYRHETMPSDREAHRLGLKGIDAIAAHLFDRRFVDLQPLDQDCVLKTLHDGAPPAGQDIWNRMPVVRYWMLLVQDVLEQYYAHPFAWDEIGFGGPAYPRAYVRLERGDPEPWEVSEQRYEWEAPPQSLSGKPEPMGHDRKGATPGQEGSH